MTVRMGLFLAVLVSAFLGFTLYVFMLASVPDKDTAMDEKIKEIERLKARVAKCQRTMTPIKQQTEIVMKDDHLYRCIEIEIPDKEE